MSHARGWKARQQQGRDAHQRGPPPLPQANARPPPPMMSGVSGNGRPRNRDKNRRQQRLQAVRDLGKVSRQTGGAAAIPSTMPRRGRPKSGGSSFQPGAIQQVLPGAAASGKATPSSLSSSAPSSSSSSFTAASSANPPSWCHSGDNKGLTKKYTEKIKALADTIVDELRSSYQTRNNRNPKKPPNWYRRYWKTYAKDGVQVAVWYPELESSLERHEALRLKGNVQYCPYCKSKGKKVALEAHADIKKIVYGMEGLHVLCAKRYICRACQKAMQEAARAAERRASGSSSASASVQAALSAAKSSAATSAAASGAKRVCTYNGWHPVLLDQLPLHVRSRFDYHVYQGKSVTRTLLSVLQHSAVNGGTFEMFAKALDEARNIEDAHRAGAYYFAEIAKREYNSSAGHLGFSQQMKIQHLPSIPRRLLSGRQLSNVLFAAKLKQMVERGEIAMQYLGGCTILSADESMKVNSLTRCPVGTRTKLAEGVTSVRGNQSGRVAIVFNPDKNTNYEFIARVIQREYDGLAVDERRHFYIVVDNCCTIRDTLKSKIPILNTLPTTLPIYELPRKTKIVIIESHDDAMMLLRKLAVDGVVEKIGFDMEWPVNKEPGSRRGKVAWWQIAPANEKNVYLIHTDYLKVPTTDAMHQDVWAFLKSETPKKLGVSVMGDVRRMYKDYNNGVPFTEQLELEVAKGIVDLRPLAKEKLKLVCGLQQLSLAKITERVLQKTLLKPRDIRVSPHWRKRGDDLPTGFKKYAAADARVAVDIWLELTKKSGAQKRRRAPSDDNDDSNSASVAEQQVLLDIFHLLQRYGRSLSQTHHLFKLFMSMMSDAFYITDWTQVEELKSAIKYSQGLSDEDVEKIGKKYFRKRTQRLVPTPEILAARVNSVYDFFVAVDKTISDKLLVGDAHRCHVSALRHIFNGCVSDPVGVPMYRDISSAGARMLKLLCFRGTSALEGFHRWLRSFTSAVYLNPVLMNGLLHEFMSRFNAKASIKNLGVADFGFFEFDLLDTIAKVVEPHVGPTRYFDTNPLCVGGVYYVQQPQNNGDTFGLTPMMEAAEAEISAALGQRNSTDGDLQEPNFHCKEDSVFTSSIADMKPLKHEESVTLCQKLYTEMMETDNQIDWKSLQNMYNHEVGKVKVGDGTDADKRKFVFANESQLRTAVQSLSEAAIQKQILKGPLLTKCIELRKNLKDSSGVHFQPADLRRAQSMVAPGGSDSSAGSSSGAGSELGAGSSSMASGGSDSGSGSSSMAAAGGSAMATGLATAGGSAHVGDWTRYPICVRTKVCKLEDGREWTKELLEQRLDVLRRVRWCLCCDEVCQVRSDRNAKWSDAEIIGDCHRKNPVMRNNGSAYPECNKMGVWKSVKQTPQLRNYRNNEIRKLQGRIAKVVASASGQRKKKKVKK